MTFLLSLFGFAQTAVGYIGSWLSKRSLTEIACIALALVCLVQFVSLRGERRHSAKVETALRKCTDARKADRKSYEAAQKAAHEKNLAEVRKAESQYKRNNDEAVTNLNARLERLRRELRAQSGAPASPAGRSSPPQADDSSGDVDSSRVCIATKDFLRAAESEERHDQLITLIQKQIGY